MMFIIKKHVYSGEYHSSPETLSINIIFQYMNLTAEDAYYSSTEPLLLIMAVSSVSKCI